MQYSRCVSPDGIKCSVSLNATRKSWYPPLWFFYCSHKKGMDGSWEASILKLILKKISEIWSTRLTVSVSIYEQFFVGFYNFKLCVCFMQAVFDIQWSDSFETIVKLGAREKKTEKEKVKVEEENRTRTKQTREGKLRKLDVLWCDGCCSNRTWDWFQGGCLSTNQPQSRGRWSDDWLPW